MLGQVRSWTSSSASAAALVTRTRSMVAASHPSDSPTTDTRSVSASAQCHEPGLCIPYQPAKQLRYERVLRVCTPRSAVPNRDDVGYHIEYK